MTRPANSLLINDFEPEVQIVFREMCKRVGANADELDFGHKEDPADEWFHKFTWTKEEHDDFIEWFYNRLYTNAKARRQFGVIGRSKAACRKKANIMVWYTWDQEGSWWFNKLSGDNLK